MKNATAAALHNRRNYRGVLAAGAVLSVAALSVSGCSAQEPTTTETVDGTDVELVFLNQSRGQEEALNQLAAEYTDETGVKVTVDSPGPADYMAKLQAQAQSNSMPDVYSFLSPTDMAPFINAGWAMNLQDELDGAWGEEFSPVLLELSRFTDGNSMNVEPGIYSAHWEIATQGMLINSELTGMDGGDPPATMDEFIDGLAESDSSGLGSFSVASSVVPYLIQAYASNWLTDEEIEATLTGEASWETEGWNNAFQVLLDMKEAGVLADGTLPGGADDNPTVEADFFSNQTLGAIFDHSAGVSVGLRTAPDFSDFFSLGVPAADDGDLEPRAVGLVGKGAAINPKGANPEEALAFVKWLTEPEQQAVFAEVGRILPSNTTLLASGNVPDQLEGFAANIENLQDFSASFSPDVRSAIVAESQRLVLGEITIDELLASVQAAQDRTS
jgi:raffinose/stachyose/melibiose transport system substrate-binding protein